MKSHVNAPGYASAFATRSWARFSPTSSIPASASTGELLDRHVLDRGQDLDLGRVAPGGGDLGADPLEVRPIALGPRPLISSTTPAPPAAR